MTTRSDFSLAGVGSTIQYGKAGGKLSYDPLNSTFNVKLPDDTTFANIKAENITLNEGDVIISSPLGKLTISDVSLVRQDTGVLKFDSDAAVSIPSGPTETRPTTPSIGMVRINNTNDGTTTPFLEYYNGSTWQAAGATPLPEFLAVAPITALAGENSITFQLETVPVAYGGTGTTFIPQNTIPYGNNELALQSSLGLTYDDTTRQLKVGTEFPVIIDGNSSSISAAAENNDLFLLPNGSGYVVLGGVGQTLLTAGTGESFTVKALDASLVLESENANTIMQLTAGSTNKVTVQGPTAEEYAQGLNNGDLVNKYYVDQLFGALNGGSF